VPAVAGGEWRGGGGSAAERVSGRRLDWAAVGWGSGGDVGAVLGDGAGGVSRVFNRTQRLF